MADAYTFVKEALALNVPKDKIHVALKAAGWDENEISAAMEAYLNADIPIPVPKRKPYGSAREAFVYLVIFLCLYLSALGFGALLFDLIDMGIKDALNPLSTVAPRDIRSALSMLIISFPIYLWLTARTAHRLIADPEMKNSLVRKWLTYITLFIATGVIIGTLISLLFAVFNDALTLRFTLKVLTVLFITACIYGYYLFPKITGKVLRPAAYAAIVSGAVVAAVIAGLMVNRSPRAERQLRFDDQRISELQQLVGAVDFFYLQNTRLPASLVELTDKYGASLVPSTVDPVSKQPYEYKVTGPTSYEVCATFAAGTAPATPSAVPGVLRTWQHGPGISCFPFQESGPTK